MNAISIDATAVYYTEQAVRDRVVKTYGRGFGGLISYQIRIDRALLRYIPYWLIDFYFELNVRQGLTKSLMSSSWNVIVNELTMQNALVGDDFSFQKIKIDPQHIIEKPESDEDEFLNKVLTEVKWNLIGRYHARPEVLEIRQSQRIFRPIWEILFTRCYGSNRKPRQLSCRFNADIWLP